MRGRGVAGGCGQRNHVIHPHAKRIALTRVEGGRRVEGNDGVG